MRGWLERKNEKIFFIKKQGGGLENEKESEWSLLHLLHKQCMS